MATQPRHFPKKNQPANTVPKRQSLKECPEKNWNYKCANCISYKSKTVNHDVASNKCPFYNHEMNRAQKLISYDE